jgi:hypothetical protein
VRRDAAINQTEAALAALANALILQLRLTCSRLRGDLVAKDDLNDRPWHAPSVAVASLRVARSEWVEIVGYTLLRTGKEPGWILQSLVT